MSGKNLRIRRFEIVLNYISLVLVALLVHFAETRGLVVWEIALTLLLVALVVFTFVQTQVKTRLWHFVHAKVRNLDERELELTHESLRLAYAIFSVVTLVLLLFYEVFYFARDAMMPRDVIRITFLFLLYLAHTLPAAVIGWGSHDKVVWGREEMT